ncbi:Retrotransposon Copia-like N-terminal protein [Dioscorea alata]|uniref:Retrotransposon Copia-like N-terminal protein n=1 Tax=Dioscorea alata TaxID=55571 RepID=A0ACB7TPG6_DIOAL|nr:Retrotransposon Copia-like N-terminal protein [Dioscorea alata]
MRTSSATDSSSSPVPADAIASVINVASVKTHVPITLDITGSNYSQWSTLFTVFVGKYGLLGFINGTIEPIIDEPYRWQDFVVHWWLYGSVSEEIFEMIIKPNQTARQTWTAIEKLFRDNKESHASKRSSISSSKGT